MPHFSEEALADGLSREGIAYVHERGLGGRRSPAANSRNTGWRSKSFQGYADHMATDEFGHALDRVVETAGSTRTAIMCAEAVWWRCHRMLIADALTVGGWRVLHVGLGGKPQEHRLTPFALVEGGQLTYPAAQGSLPIGTTTA
jgi:uncharacterized protein (DUF488 family)